MKNLVIIPLKIEQKAFIETLSNYKPSRSVDNCFHLAQLDTVCALGGLGGKKFSKNLQKLIKKYSGIKQVFAMGSCGALKEELLIEDIIVGTSIKEDRATQAINLQTKKYENILKDFNKTNVHFGTIVSVDQNILSEKQRDAIYKKTKGLCVSWESMGGAMACIENNISYNEFRVITDLCNSQSKEIFSKTIRPGMTLLAQLYLHLLKQH